MSEGKFLRLRLGGSLANVVCYANLQVLRRYSLTCSKWWDQLPENYENWNVYRPGFYLSALLSQRQTCIISFHFRLGTF